ncbi:MAG: phosphomannomutase/phosphoglucomutase [Ornithinimicrobium sp.]
MTLVDLSAFIKAYDIRGLVDGQLTPRVCRAIGSAFAHVIAQPDGHRRIVLGHDMRASSPALADAFGDGVREAGLDVVLIGLCATDELYFATGTLRCPGAMITASHNPATYNGIKLCRSEAVPLEMATGLELVRDLAQWMLDRPGLSPQGPSSAAPSPPGQPAQSVRTATIREHDVLADYSAYLHSLVDLRDSRPLRIVVDAGNGMAGLTAPAVFGAAAPTVEMIGLYLDLDGSFPHHEANPLDPANLVDLQASVVAHGADLGLAFDGDADRCFVVDEQGAAVTASAITALVAAREIAKEVARGVPVEQVSVVHNSITSRVVPHTVIRCGAQAVMAKVGHSYVKAAMAEHDAVFGGEHSGHYYFRDFWRADTGMLAALHVLAALGHQPSGCTMSALVEPYTRYAHSGEINSVVGDVPAALQHVRDWAAGLDSVPAITEFDGIAISSDGPGGHFWTVSVRSSNTEALLRLNVEAHDEETMRTVRDAVLAVIVGTVSL